MMVLTDIPKYADVLASMLFLIKNDLFNTSIEY